MFLYDNGMLKEHARIKNYRGIVDDVYYIPETKILIVRTVSNIVYYVQIKEQPTVQLLQELKPLQILQKDNTTFLFSLPLQLRLYSFDTKDFGFLLSTLQVSPNILSCNASHYVYAANLPNKPAVEMGFSLRMKFSLYPSTTAGIVLCSWEGGEILSQNITPKSISALCLDSKTKSLAAVDVTGTYVYVYLIGTMQLKLSNMYFRGVSQADTKQLFFSHDSRYLIFVTSKSVRFIQLSPLSVTIEEESVYLLSFPECPDVTVSELQSPKEGEYIYIVCTTIGVYHVWKIGRVYYVEEFPNILENIKQASTGTEPYYYSQIVRSKSTEWKRPSIDQWWFDPSLCDKNNG